MQFIALPLGISDDGYQANTASTRYFWNSSCTPGILIILVITGTQGWMNHSLVYSRTLFVIGQDKSLFIRLA